MTGMMRLHFDVQLQGKGLQVLVLPEHQQLDDLTLFAVLERLNRGLTADDSSAGVCGDLDTAKIKCMPA